jgi:hypothetical protein
MSFCLHYWYNPWRSYHPTRELKIEMLATINTKIYDFGYMPCSKMFVECFVIIIDKNTWLVLAHNVIMFVHCM